MFHTYIQDLVKANEIPCAALAIRKDGKLTFLQSYGSFKDKNNNVSYITKNSLFDVASLTKVLVTLPSILYLQEKDDLSLEGKVQKYLPEFNHSGVKIKHLLQHSSWLPADLPYRNRNRTETRDVVKEIIHTKLIFKPGAETQYSDLGMILLGKIVEKVSGQALNNFYKTYLFEPWKMNNTTFLLESDLSESIVSAELFQDTYIQGEVHDEKAYQLGGVSGSAGLFSTVSDISTYTNYWMYPETQSVLTKESMTKAWENILNSRGLGFEVFDDSNNILSCGEKWAKGSFGHTGFTGTNLSIDPVINLSVTFLTNIEQNGREHRMHEIRKTVHSLIYNAYSTADWKEGCC